MKDEPSRVKCIAASMLLMALLFAMPSAAAHAEWTTIDTNNGQIDAAWGAPTYSDPCGDIAEPRDEIKNAWYKYDGTSLTFRMETCGASVLSGNSMRAIAAIDCNNDGDFTDPASGGPAGDRLAAFYYGYDFVYLLDGAGVRVAQMPDASYAEVSGANLEWKSDLLFLYPACRGSSGPANIAWATVKVQFGTSTTIDQSKQIYAWTNPMDYGDLPNPNPAVNPPTCEQYPSRIGCNGPRHGVDAGSAILGAAIDPDGGDLYNVMAAADDASNTGAADDEDGVSPAQAVAWTSAGGALDVIVADGSGYVSCWIDWNNNQSFSDAGEKVISDRSLSPGRYAINISTPATVTGVYYARCRVSPGTGAGITGAIYGGEVEDYRWLPQTSPLAISRPSSTSPNAQLSWTEVSTADTYNIYRSAAPYLQPGGTPHATVADAPFLDPVLGGAANTYFYVMTKKRTVDSTPLESVVSNEVGVFEFSLSAGS